MATTRLVGREGDDLLIGGSGFDIVDYALAGGGGSVIVDLAAGTATDSFGDADTIREIEHVIGADIYSVAGSAFDELFGDDNDNRFTGNGGVDVDRIDGRDGSDWIDYRSEFATQNYLPGTLTPGGTGVGVVVNLSVEGTVNSPNATDTRGHGDALVSIENVVGSIRDDTITGSAEANTIIGGDGKDTLDGGAGVDTLDYSGDRVAPSVGITIDDSDPTQNRDQYGDTDVLSNFEVIIATDFADSITRDVSPGAQVIYSGEGDDTLSLFGTPGQDDTQFLFAGAGNDTGGGSSGTDFIFGGTGNDTFAGNGGNDVYVYTGGVDGYFGRTGITDGVETANFSLFGSAIRADLGTEIFETADTFDVATGTVFRTLLQSGGIDGVTGSAFNDLILDDADDNQIAGSGGDDSIVNADGTDTIDGGEGLDRLGFAAGTQGVTVDLGFVGVNLTDAFGNSEQVTGVEHIIGTAMADSFTGSAGNDIFTGGDGVDSYFGGAGFDTIDLSFETGDGPTSVTFSVDAATGEITGTLTDSFGNQESFFSIERVIGGNGSFDDLIGGDGDETFVGGAGSGVDFIDGNLGIDTVDYSAEGGSGGATVDLSREGAVDDPNATDTFGDPDALQGIENLIGTRETDVFTGNAAANALVGNGGNDVFFGSDGADSIYGGAGQDTVNFGLETGSTGIAVDLRARVNQALDTFGAIDQLFGIENVVGSVFDDSITGDVGANTLSGEGNSDFLDGWSGDDVLYGQSETRHLAGMGGRGQPLRWQW